MGHSNTYFMNRVLKLTEECIPDRNRTPFGSIVVKENEIIGIGKESSYYNFDPTAHSEIEAIRDACKNLRSSCLEDATLYSSSEPCSMCLSALYWAGIKEVYYSCSRKDVSDFGYPDRFQLMEKSTFDSRNRINMTQLLRDDGIKIFSKNEKLMQIIDPINFTSI